MPVCVKRKKKKKKAELRNSSEEFLCITANMQLLVSECVCGGTEEVAVGSGVVLQSGTLKNAGREGTKQMGAAPLLCGRPSADSPPHTEPPPSSPHSLSSRL